MASTILTLEIVEQAIKDILTTGQSYINPGLTLTRASLAELVKLRNTMIKEADRSSSGNGVAIVSDFTQSTGGTESSDWGE